MECPKIFLPLLALMTLVATGACSDITVGDNTGGAGWACFDDGTCLGALTCVSGVCVALDTAGPADGITGDGHLDTAPSDMVTPETPGPDTMEVGVDTPVDTDVGIPDTIPEIAPDTAAEILDTAGDQVDVPQIDATDVTDTAGETTDTTPACIDECDEAGTYLCDGATVVSSCVESGLGCLVWAPMNLPCADTNPCTDALCDPSVGCTYPPNEEACDDGNPCTDGDQCDAGACVSGEYVCGDCVEASDCADFDDGDLCNGTLTCATGQCLVDPATIVACDTTADTLCVMTSCIPETGSCEVESVPDGTPCFDGDSCTLVDTCLGGFCNGTSPITCLPIDGCHLGGVCDPDTGICTDPPAADGTACDDGDEDTPIDVCIGGVCMGSPCECLGADECCDGCDPINEGVQCADDLLTCTSDLCQAGECVHAPLEGECAIDGECFDDGTNAPGEPCLVCDTTSSQVEWTAVTDGLPCEDGSDCTLGDTCQTGSCTSGAPIVCPAPDPCEAEGVCNPLTGGCEYEPLADGSPCDDGDPTTGNDTCQASVCAGVTCTCTGVNACCDGCAPLAEGGACNDGDLCTTSDTCTDGVCVGSEPVQCPASGPCRQVAACEPATGQCPTTNAPQGDPCSDDNDCTVDDQCNGEGLCVGTWDTTICSCQTDDDCASLTTPCAIGRCDDTAFSCFAEPQTGTACDDQSLCTTDDVCDATGTCVGAAIDCGDGLDCTVDSCEPATGVCSSSVAPGSCLIDEVCYTSGEDNPSNACQECNPAFDSAWFPVGAGVACDDGDPCTTSESCDGGGTCAGVVDKDDDGDGFVDATCPGGDDCDDTVPLMNPNAFDPIDDVTAIIEPIDAGGPRGTEVAAVVDGQGHVHAVWYSTYAHALEYATDRFGWWGTAYLDLSADVGHHPAIAVGPDDALHVTYWDTTNSQLRYASNATGTWVTESITADYSDGASTRSAVAVTPDGVVHVFFKSGTTDDLVTRSLVDGAWGAVEPIDTVGNVGGAPAVEVADDGSLHVVYLDNDASGVNYATNQSGAWVIEAVTASSTNSFAAELDIAVGSDGIIHAAFRDTSADDFIHAWRAVDGTWSLGPVYQGGNATNPTGNAGQVQVNDDGELFFCYTKRSVVYIYTYYELWFAKSYSQWDDQDHTYRQMKAGTLADEPWCAMAKGPDDSIHYLWSELGSQHLSHEVVAPSGGGWHIVDGDGNQGIEPSLAMGPDGVLHAAYRDATNTALKHAQKAPGEPWKYETVDNAANLGEWSSIAVDPLGQIHIAYYDTTDNDLKYARGVWGSWIVEAVDTAGNVGQYTSLVVDGANVPYIAYHDATTTALKFASRASGMWASEIVDNEGNDGQYAALAIGSDGVFHIAYRYATTNDLKYVKGTFGAWQPPQAVNTDSDCGRWNSIVLDASNNPHIAHQQASNTLLRHTWSVGGGNAGTWQTEDLQGTGNAGRFTGIGMDDAGGLYISFDGDSTLELAYLPTGGEWAYTSVDTVNVDGTSLVVEPDGTWHIAYRDAGAADLRYASSELGSPGATTIASKKGNQGIHTAVTAGVDGVVQYAFFDEDQDDLRYGKMDEGALFHTVLDEAGNVGQWADIAVDDQGVAHLAYRDATNTDLKYAAVAPDGAVTIDVVDDTANVGEYASIAVDDAGVAHISYYDTTSDDLKYATGGPGAWTLEVLDEAGTVGIYTSMAVDDAGWVHIAYHYNNSNDLRYLTNKGGAWAAPVDVQTTSDVGDYAEIAVMGDTVAIVYRDNTNNDLRYASNTTGTWLNGAVETGGSVGFWPAVELDTAGNAYISYEDDSTDDLTFATNISGSWQLFDIDTDGAVGTYTDLVLGGKGTVYVTYHDQTDTDAVMAILSIVNTVDENCDGF